MPKPMIANIPNTLSRGCGERILFFEITRLCSTFAVNALSDQLTERRMQRRENEQIGIGGGGPGA